MPNLTCHCGAVEAEINLNGDLAKVIKCNCSICKRKNATMATGGIKSMKISRRDFLKGTATSLFLAGFNLPS